MLALNQLGDGFASNAHRFIEGHPCPPGNANVYGCNPGVEVHFRLSGWSCQGCCRDQQQGKH